MSSYKQLYMHLANADGTFNLLELAALDTALSQYIETLKKLNVSDDVKIVSEIQISESALKKVKKLYQSAHGPKA